MMTMMARTTKICNSGKETVIMTMMAAAVAVAARVVIIFIAVPAR